jgi:hypothetical protein
MINICYVYESDPSWAGRIIRWFTNGKFSHVAICYESSDWKDVWVVEAVLKGVLARPVRNRKWAAIVRAKYDAAPYVRSAEKFIGEKYDIPSLLIFGWLILAWRWFRLKVRRPHRPGNSQFCSELAAHTILPVLGYVIPDPQWVDPDQLYALQKAYPEFFEVDI